MTRPVDPILVVEDEKHLAAGLKLNLTLEGFEVTVAASGREAMALFMTQRFAAVVLDVMLPDTDGFELCERLRSSGNVVPVLMLTARTQAVDRVRGLNAGADDYLGKPFEFDELVARLRSLLRRQSWQDEGRDELPCSVVAFGDAEVDFDTHRVTVNGQEHNLTQLELELLRFFADHPGRVVSRDELLEKVWKLRHLPHTRTVDNFISRLRKVFERDPKNPRYFVSHRGSGYRFVPEP